MATSSPTTSKRIPLVVDRVKQQIRSRIGRDWQVGDRLPPIEELARSLGVGARNAYRAVHELADEGLLASRPHHGTYVTDRPQRVATPTAPTAKRSRVIQVPLGPDADGMIHRMAHACGEHLRALGYTVQFAPTTQARNMTLDLTQVDADGFVLTNVHSYKVLLAPHHVVSLIDTAGQPPANLTSRYDLVGPDNEQGGTMAGECFKAYGIRDVGFLGVRKSAGEDVYGDLDHARLRGLERGLGQLLPAHRRYYADAYSEPDGVKFALKYKTMSDRPAGLFISTDDMASGFVCGGYAVDLEKRRDYQLIGFDGQSRGRAVVGGGITTVAVPAEAMGQQAAAYLDSRFDQPDLPPRRLALGCSILRGKTMPVSDKPHLPFANEARYWPAPPEGI